jgi:hypothetical protein
MKLILCLPLAALLLATYPASAANAPQPIPLWPQTAPGEKGDLGPEQDITKEKDDKVAGRPVIRLGNVSQPTLTVYPAPPDKATGAAMIVCPGGGYHILAVDLEGTEGSRTGSIPSA